MTLLGACLYRTSCISTHTPLARCDKHRKWSGDSRKKFLLTHLLRGVTVPFDFFSCGFFISTHTPLARCDYNGNLFSDHFQISTHTPLARCDIIAVKIVYHIHISTHTPLARCDSFFSISVISSCSHFYSHTSCEVWRVFFFYVFFFNTISTHTPLARCDQAVRLLCRESTISTHTPLARCDLFGWISCWIK